MPTSLADWFARHHPRGAAPRLSMVPRSTTAGFSAETVLFDLGWDDDVLPSGAFVLKMAPVDDPHPLFPTYDLARQVGAMRVVAASGGVTVPAVPWFEPDPTVLGSPFVVMERIAGEVAPDVPPYTFGGWLLDAGPDERVRVERSFVAALAGVHSVTTELADLSALELDDAGDTPLARHVAHQRAYYDWIRGDRRFPVVERAFEWLDERWPAEAGPSGVVWGDARLANAMFRGGEVVALLDWEAAAVGPSEIDLAWTLYFGDYFQRVAVRHGHPGLPGFMPAARVVDGYTDALGRAPRDLGWHLVYATLRQALTSIRVWERAVLRGQHPEPTDHQDLIADRARLEDLLDGRVDPDPTGWSS
jgi:aminoglycoside phosphotransferase (APT) family kinase protein